MESEGTRWDRYMIGSGFVFVALLFAAVFLSPAIAMDVPVEEFNAHYSDNYDGILIGSFMSGLSSVFLLVFLGGLFSALRRAEGGTGSISIVALSGGVVMTVALLLGSMSTASAALTFDLAGDGGTEATRALHILANATGIFFAFPLAAFLASASIVMLRSEVAPRWIGWLGGLATPINLISIGSISESDDGLLGLFGFLGVVLFVVWMLATSTALLRRSQVRQPRADSRVSTAS